jgi:hypothetical protein
MLSKVGFHLGNKELISANSWTIMERVPPKAVIFITGERISADDLKRILDISPECHFFYRPYFAPSDSRAAQGSYIQAVGSMIDDNNRSYFDFVPEPQRHLQIFNEQNMPRWSQWEGFGSRVDDMHRFNEAFCGGYDYLKSINPTFKIGFTPLTPGNRDTYFRTDPAGVPYYMHGPEAAKEKPTLNEIVTALRNGPCYEALRKADEYLAHIYVLNDAEHQMQEHWGGLRFDRYAKFLPKSMDIWITELGIGHPAENWRRWYKLLEDYPSVKGTCIWRLEYEVRDPGSEMVRVLQSYVESLPEEEPEPPTLPIPTVPVDLIRSRAWLSVDVPFNPDAAFPVYARQNNLGAPLAGEVDVGYEGQPSYRLQAFVGGIVYAEVGKWDDVDHIEW